MGASSWFTRRLEAICDVFDLPPSLLSLLGALGANIPNYAASIYTIASGSLGTGLGIIIGSNIYNITIILAIATFASRKRHGIALTRQEAKNARIVAYYTLAIMLSTLLTVWLLPGTPLLSGQIFFLGQEGLGNSLSLQFYTALFLLAALLSIGLFVLLSVYALRRTNHHTDTDGLTREKLEPEQVSVGKTPTPLILRWIGEGIFALLLALGGVVVMVQSGQTLTGDLHMPTILAGLLILAVATSLPNTVVALIFARTNRETACVEEIFSSNSINATLGIALPLLFWHVALHDTLLLTLDAPLMVGVTLAALLCVLVRRVNRFAGSAFLGIYLLWVVLHVLL